MRGLVSTLFVSCMVAVVVSAGGSHHAAPWGRRGIHLSRMPVEAADVEHNVTYNALEKRAEGARFTYYDAGLGACGKVNSNADLIVALNVAQWDGGSHCFETISITINGKTSSAQITDQCPGCPYGGLDFSRGLFNVFASESVGVLTGSWNFGGAAAPAPPAPKPTPTPTPTPPPPPPPPTTTQQPTSPPPPPPTTSSTPASSAIPSSSSLAQKPTSTSSPAASPSPSVVASTDGNIEQLYQLFVSIGGLTLTSAFGTN